MAGKAGKKLFEPGISLACIKHYSQVTTRGDFIVHVSNGSICDGKRFACHEVREVSVENAFAALTKIKLEAEYAARAKRATASPDERA